MVAQPDGRFDVNAHFVPGMYREAPVAAGHGRRFGLFPKRRR